MHDVMHLQTIRQGQAQVQETMALLETVAGLFRQEVQEGEQVRLLTQEIQEVN